MDTRKLEELREMINELINAMIAQSKSTDSGIVKKLPSKEEVQKIVTEHIQELAVPANIKGYEYLRTAICMVIEEPTLARGITKILYPSIAKKFEDTPAKVERAIRHAIESAWNRIKPEKVYEIFGYTISKSKGKPTNSEFISILADHIKIYHF